jgi:seryl-tRNA synthetase
MLSMQQMEELEVRILKALELITDLRSENARLESENERIRAENEEIKLKFEEKDREIIRLKKEWTEATSQLQKLKDKEEMLEKKVVEMLARLESIKPGSIPTGDRAPKVRSSPSVEKKEEVRLEKKEVVKESGVGIVAAPPSPMESDEAIDIDTESVEITEQDEEEILIEDDDEIILLDEDAELDADSDVEVKEEVSDSEEFRDSSGDDEVLLEDDDEDLDVFDEDDDFLVIEEDSKENTPK